MQRPLSIIKDYESNRFLGCAAVNNEVLYNVSMVLLHQIESNGPFTLESAQLTELLQNVLRCI